LILICWPADRGRNTGQVQFYISGEDRTPECLEFVREHELYKQALDLFQTNTEEYKVLFH